MTKEYGPDNRRTGGERREDYFPTHVTGELRRLDKCLSSVKQGVADIRQQLNDHKILQAKDVTELKVKSGIISGIISMLVSAIVAAFLAWVIK